MKRKSLLLTTLVIVFLAINPANLFARNPSVDPKQVSITFDDLPLNGPHIDLARLRTMTGKLLAGFKRYRIPVVGFVNESLLYVPGETDARIELLNSWLSEGAELGNHTFSHLGFSNASLAEYEDDFIHGEALTRLLVKQKGQKLRFFRHPYLQMGSTRETELAFEKFIFDRGYSIAPVTVDTADWVFLAAYSKARDQGDTAMMRRVSEEYLKFVGLKFESSENAADRLFGHPVKQILLLHANELNADNIDALVQVMKNRGYEFISLESGLEDPIYKYPEKYVATSNWLGQWAFDKGIRFDSPSPPDFVQKIYDDSLKQ